MKYFLFIDESGDHGITNIDPNFPVIALCGLLTRGDEHQTTVKAVRELKKHFWQEKQVFLHSRDIRKCDKEFCILLDPAVKNDFYTRLNAIMSDSKYVIICAVIDKEKYVKKYGKLGNDVYQIALSFLIERSVFYLDDLPGTKQLDIILENRGAKEDQNLKEHFQRIHSRGTFYVDGSRIRNYGCTIQFMTKAHNAIGLQLADIAAYPIARYVMDKDRANPAFDLLATKFYKKRGRRYGLKIFP